MYWYTRAAAKKIESSALMADAWHHRSDALSSIGSFAGVLGARLGMPVLDPVASVVICLFILKAAWDIFQDAISKMIDRACPAEVEARMRTAALEQEGVLGIDRLQTRLFGDLLECFGIRATTARVQLFTNLCLAVMVIRRAVPDTLPLFVPEAADETADFQIQGIVACLEKLREQDTHSR